MATALKTRFLGHPESISALLLQFSLDRQDPPRAGPGHGPARQTANEAGVRHPAI